MLGAPLSWGVPGPQQFPLTCCLTFHFTSCPLTSEVLGTSAPITTGQRVLPAPAPAFFPVSLSEFTVWVEHSLRRARGDAPAGPCLCLQVPHICPPPSGGAPLLPMFLPHSFRPMTPKTISWVPDPGPPPLMSPGLSYSLHPPELSMSPTPTPPPSVPSVPQAPGPDTGSSFAAHLPPPEPALILLSPPLCPQGPELRP